MKTWQIVLLVLLGTYIVGAGVMFAFLRGTNWKMAVLWPFTVLWMLFGNIG